MDSAKRKLAAYSSSCYLDHTVMGKLELDQTTQTRTRCLLPLRGGPQKTGHSLEGFKDNTNSERAKQTDIPSTRLLLLLDLVDLRRLSLHLTGTSQRSMDLSHTSGVCNVLPRRERTRDGHRGTRASPKPSKSRVFAFLPRRSLSGISKLTTFGCNRRGSRVVHTTVSQDLRGGTRSGVHVYTGHLEPCGG